MKVNGSVVAYRFISPPRTASLLTGAKTVGRTLRVRRRPDHSVPCIRFAARLESVPYRSLRWHMRGWDVAARLESAPPPHVRFAVVARGEPLCHDFASLITGDSLLSYVLCLASLRLPPHHASHTLAPSPSALRIDTFPYWLYNRPNFHTLVA